MAEKPKVRRKAPAATANKPPKAAVPPPATEAPAAPPPATPKAMPKVTSKGVPEARPEAPPGWKADAFLTPGGAVSVVTLVSGPDRSCGPGGSTYARAAGSGDGTVAGFDPRRDTLALVGMAEARVEPVGEGEVAVRLPDGTTVTLRLRG